MLTFTNISGNFNVLTDKDILLKSLFNVFTAFHHSKCEWSVQYCHWPFTWNVQVVPRLFN